MARSSWGFEPGTEIVPGRHVLARMGGGSRYEVYLATDDTLASTAVAKIVRPEFVAEERSLRALRREARRLNGLTHPRIVRLFDVVPDGARPHLLLEHLEGPTLRSLIKTSGRLPGELLVAIGLDLASVLVYLEAKGIVHLDVKPSNVVVGAGATLVDFSIARPADRVARLSTPVGTAATMAPEQCDPVRLGPVGHPADVWGWGVSMHEAMTGERAFPGAKLGGPYPQLDGGPKGGARAPEALVELVRSCVAADPGSRPRPTDLLARLEPLVAELPTRPVLRNRRPKLG